MGPEVAEAIDGRIEALKEALAPWSRGKPYLNFAEKRVAIGDAIGAEAFARLERIKASVDPDGRFRSGHRVRHGDGLRGARTQSPRRPRDERGPDSQGVSPNGGDTTSLSRLSSGSGRAASVPAPRTRRPCAAARCSTGGRARR